MALKIVVTMTPSYNEPRYNEEHLKARQNYSEICGNEPRYTKSPNKSWRSQRTIFPAVTNISFV